MINYESILELNKLINEIASLYSEKVKTIIESSEDQENPNFTLDDLFELRKIRAQLDILFRIRDNCQQILNDLQLLQDATHPLN
jgi:hypothetical protein